MLDISNVKFTIAFIDPDLDPEERDMQAQNLMGELMQMDELEAVDRVLDPNPPQGNKSIGGALAGMLTAEVSIGNAKKVVDFLSNRLRNKPIELSVEGNGKKLSVKAHSREDLEVAIQTASDFLEA